jgi:flagellar basal-body rod protein FlgB
MLANVFRQTTIPVFEEVICFAQARHEVLAGNIANLDTPGYQTADLSPQVFQQRLREALATRETNDPVQSPRLQAASVGDPIRRVRDSMQAILRHDESNVGLEQQVIAMTDNQFTHNMAIALMNSQFRLLDSAISERV